MLEAKCTECCAQGRISPMRSPRSPNSPPTHRQFMNRQQNESSDMSMAPATSALPLTEIMDWFWKDTAMQIGEQGRTENRFLDTFSLLQAAQSHGPQRSRPRRHYQRRKRNIWHSFKRNSK